MSRPRRKTPPALRVLSLGGGVQSTVMCLLAERGAFGVKPDYAIFADTKWEPQSVYDTIEWLQTQVSFPIITTDNGRSLRDDVVNGVNAQGQPWMTLPVYLAEPNGESAGINWRQCTKNYKLDPIRRVVQELLGVRPRQNISHETHVEMWLGISTDEAMRVKPNRNWWITNRYPLIDDLPLTREECRQWFADEYPGRSLTRSACVGCPFRSSSSWLDVKANEPELYAEVVQIDALIRSEEHNSSRMFRKRPYLHHRRIPLQDALRLDEQEFHETNQFINECEGHCGL